MFDTLKNLELLQNKLKKKHQNQITGRNLLETEIEHMKILIRVGYVNQLQSQKHIHENEFFISHTSGGSYESYKFPNFYKKLQEENLFDEFKFRLEEKLLTDV
jgi:hypothetical protein